MRKLHIVVGADGVSEEREVRIDGMPKRSKESALYICKISLLTCREAKDRHVMPYCTSMILGEYATSSFKALSYVAR